MTSYNPNGEGQYQGFPNSENVSPVAPQNSGYSAGMSAPQQLPNNFNMTEAKAFLLSPGGLGFPKWWSFSYAALALLIFVFCIMPWVKVSSIIGTQSINGLHGDGVIILLLAFVAAGLGIANGLGVKLPKQNFLPVLQTVIYVLIFIVWIVDFSGAKKVMGRNSSVVSAHFAAGFYLCLLVALAGIGVSVYGILMARKLGIQIPSVGEITSQIPGFGNNIPQPSNNPYGQPSQGYVQPPMPQQPASGQNPTVPPMPSQGYVQPPIQQQPPVPPGAGVQPPIQQ